jgi:putative CocE/NonD family hydrolase
MCGLFGEGETLGRGPRSVVSRALGCLLGLPPVRTPRVRTVRDLEIPAADGVVLLADRYYPADYENAPVLLIRTPYGRRSANILLARLFAERGYQVLIQALRGTDGSGGRFDGFVMNRSDGPATIAWLRQQDWFPGAFATWGASYLGYAQWDLASTSIAEWRAAIIDVAPADFYHHFMYPGGAFALGNALAWLQLVHSLFANGRGTTPTTMWTAIASRVSAGRRFARACEHLPIADADSIATGHRIPYYQQWIGHETYDTFWAQMDYRANIAHLPPTVHLGAGWMDFFLPDVLDNYARLKDSGRTVRVLIGSGAHGQNMASRTYQRDTFALLDSVFGDVGAAARLEPASVRMKITGRTHWRNASTWPPAHRPSAWYPQPGGALDTHPAPTCEPSHYRYDPADPTPTTGGTAVGLRAGGRDNRAMELRDDVLTFTSNVLTADLTVIGPVHAIVYIRSSVVDTDVFVRLCNVHPRGKSINICDGMTRLHARNFPPDSDGIRRARVELWPAGHVFREGHRIRIQISSGAHPRFNRNLGTGEPLSGATKLVIAHQDIFHDPRHHTAIQLPVAGPNDGAGLAI